MKRVYKEKEREGGGGKNKDLETKSSTHFIFQCAGNNDRLKRNVRT